jgi:hypothetical protein
MMSASLTPVQDLGICSICHERKPEGEPKIIYHGHGLCLECLTVMVTRVVEDKDTYPVDLGHYRNPFDYANHLDATLLEQYKLKELEHSTFPHERVFCFCGKFIGRLIVHRQGEEYIGVKSCSDTSCQRFSCLNCAAKLEDVADIIDHGCKEMRQAKEEDKQKMLESNERGIKFQLCPNCSRPIQLTEACHHIKCPCGTEFCYLCGKAASERSGHWRLGRCPRYPTQPAPLPPARPVTEQDHRDIAHGIGPRLAGFNERLAQIAQTGHQQGFNTDEVRELVRALQNDVADGLEVPLPPLRPEPRAPSPPPHPEIPRSVSPGLTRPRSGLNPSFAPAAPPAERVRRLRGGESFIDMAAAAMDPPRLNGFQPRDPRATHIPRPRPEMRVTINSGDSTEEERAANLQNSLRDRAFREGVRFEEHSRGDFWRGTDPTTVPTDDTERQAFEQGREYDRRRERLLNGSPTRQRVPTPEQTENATINRDDTDALSTPSPPHVPGILPGRAPRFPHFVHLPPPPFQPAATWCSTPFWPSNPPTTSTHAPHNSHFGHLPPPPPLPFVHHPPHGGFSHLPPMPISRPQAPDERQAGGPFGHLTQPPPGPWNDNDNV